MISEIRSLTVAAIFGSHSRNFASNLSANTSIDFSPSSGCSVLCQYYSRCVLNRQAFCYHKGQLKKRWRKTPISHSPLTDVFAQQVSRNSESSIHLSSLSLFAVLARRDDRTPRSSPWLRSLLPDTPRVAVCFRHSVGYFSISLFQRCIFFVMKNDQVHPTSSWWNKQAFFADTRANPPKQPSLRPLEGRHLFLTGDAPHSRQYDRTTRGLFGL